MVIQTMSQQMIQAAMSSAVANQGYQTIRTAAGIQVTVGLPCAFIGKVRINGIPAPSGTVVQPMSGGNPATPDPAITGDIQYNLGPDTYMIVVTMTEQIAAMGTEICFAVNGQLANECYEWMAWMGVDADLSITTEAVPWRDYMAGISLQLRTLAQDIDTAIATMT